MFVHRTLEQYVWKFFVYRMSQSDSMKRVKQTLSEILSALLQESSMATRITDGRARSKDGLEA